MLCTKKLNFNPSCFISYVFLSLESVEKFVVEFYQVAVCIQHATCRNGLLNVCTGRICSSQAQDILPPYKNKLIVKWQNNS